MNTIWNSQYDEQEIDFKFGKEKSQIHKKMQDFIDKDKKFQKDH